MTDDDIDRLWKAAYSDDYLRLLPKKYRPLMVQPWLNSLSVRPHVRFARMVERAVKEATSVE